MYAVYSTHLEFSKYTKRSIINFDFIAQNTQTTGERERERDRDTGSAARGGREFQGQFIFRINVWWLPVFYIYWRRHRQRHRTTTATTTTGRAEAIVRAVSHHATDSTNLRNLFQYVYNKYRSSTFMAQVSDNAITVGFLFLSLSLSFRLHDLAAQFVYDVRALFWDQFTCLNQNDWHNLIFSACFIAIDKVRSAWCACVFDKGDKYHELLEIAP